jgi:hypothetical protein
MKEKWVSFVTKINKTILGDKVCYLGPTDWKKAKPLIVLHSSKLFQICWVLR